MENYTNIFTLYEASGLYEHLIGVDYNSKKPSPGKGWSKASYQPVHTDGRAGFRVPPGMVVLDIDVKDGGKGAESFKKLTIDTGLDLDSHITVRTPSGGWHCYYSIDGKYRTRGKAHPDYPDLEIFAGLSRSEVATASKAADPVHYRHQCLIAGSDTASGTYTLETGELRITPMPDELIALFFIDPEAEAGKPAARKRTPAGEPPEVLYPKAELEYITALLTALPADTPDFTGAYGDWQRTGHILARRFGLDGLDLFMRFCMSRDGFPGVAECTRRYTEFCTSAQTREAGEGAATVASIVKAARQAVPDAYDAAKAKLDSYNAKTASDALRAVQEADTGTRPELPKGDLFKALSGTDRAKALIERAKQETESPDGQDVSLADLVSVVWFVPSSSSNVDNDRYYSDLYPDGIKGNRLKNLANGRAWADCWTDMHGDKTHCPASSFLETVIRAGKVDYEVQGLCVKPYIDSPVVRQGRQKLFNSYDRVWIQETRDLGERMIEGGTADDQVWARRIYAYLQFLRNHFKGLASGVERDGEAGYYWFLRSVQPRPRLPFALMLTGDQGIGKSIIGSIAEVIVGKQHYAKISKKMINARFNQFQVGKLFLVGEELKSKRDGADDLANDLKEFITADSMLVEPKGGEHVPHIPEHSIMLISNHKNAVRLGLNDRRYVILDCSMDRDAFYSQFGGGGVIAAAGADVEINDADDYYDYLAQPRDDAKFAERLRAYIFTLDARHDCEYGDYSTFDRTFDPAFYSKRQAYLTQGFHRVQGASESAFDQITHLFNSIIDDGYDLANAALQDAGFLALKAQTIEGCWNREDKRTNEDWISKAKWYLKHTRVCKAEQFRTGQKDADKYVRRARWKNVAVWDSMDDETRAAADKAFKDAYKNHYGQPVEAEPNEPF